MHESKPDTATRQADDSRTIPLHSRDEDCTLGDDGCCVECGVSHNGDCAFCGAGGFHKAGCPDSDATACTPRAGTGPCDCGRGSDDTRPYAHAEGCGLRRACGLDAKVVSATAVQS